jgi:hypothetical protein
MDQLDLLVLLEPQVQLDQQVTLLQQPLDNKPALNLLLILVVLGMD